MYTQLPTLIFLSLLKHYRQRIGVCHGHSNLQLREEKVGVFEGGRGCIDLKMNKVKSHTPAKKVIPHQVLLLSKNSHHNQCVQVNAFTQHPEVVATHQVQVDEL